MESDFGKQKRVGSNSVRHAASMSLRVILGPQNIESFGTRIAPLLCGKFYSARVTERAAIVAKDARQSDDQPIDDASSGAGSSDAALTGDANKKARCGPKAKPAIVASDIQGLKYFEKLKPLLARLHDIGTERDKAGNRELHMDEYCILQWLWMFSPILTSLRALQQASELDNVRKKLGVARLVALMSPARSPKVKPTNAPFWRAPLKQIAVPMDRGYAKFTLWNDIHAANSSYVCRVRDNSVYEVIEEKQLTEADRKAGVISDQIVKIGASKADDTSRTVSKSRRT